MAKTWTFYPSKGGSIVFPDQASFDDFRTTQYPGAIVHGPSVNDGTQEFGKVYDDQYR